MYCRFDREAVDSCWEWLAMAIVTKAAEDYEEGYYFLYKIYGPYARRVSLNQFKTDPAISHRTYKFTRIMRYFETKHFFHTTWCSDLLMNADILPEEMEKLMQNNVEENGPRKKQTV